MKSIFFLTITLILAATAFAEECTTGACPVTLPVFAVKGAGTPAPQPILNNTGRKTIPPVAGQKKIIHIEPDILTTSQIAGTGNLQIDDKEKARVYDAIVSVIPETTTMIHLSNLDVNRVVCPVDMGEDSVVHSKEKRVEVEIRGKNAFVKFLILKSEDKETKVTNPVELHVLCGDEVYSIIAYPQAIPAQTVKLLPRKEKQSKTALAAISHEEKLLKVVQDVYFNKVQGYTVETFNQEVIIFKEVDVLLRNILKLDSENITVREYLLRANNNLNGESIHLKEKDFVKKTITLNPAAIMLEKQEIRKNEYTRLIVVEYNKGNDE